MKQVIPVLARLFQLPGSYRTVDPVNFQPTSEEQITIAQAEASYKGFQFRGPGWYYHDHYTMLVVPSMEWDGDKFTPALVGGEQLWRFYAFPPFLHGVNHAKDALAYIATLPDRMDQPDDRPEPPEPADPLEGSRPVEVTIPPGGHLRVRVDDSDGVFDITYDFQGDQRIVVSADLPGNVIGGNVVYVEDFSLEDTDGVHVAAKPLAEPERVEEDMLADVEALHGHIVGALFTTHPYDAGQVLTRLKAEPAAMACLARVASFAATGETHEAIIADELEILARAKRIDRHVEGEGAYTYTALSDALTPPEPAQPRGHDTPEAKADLLVCLRGSRAAGRITAGENGLLQRMEEWLVRAAEASDAPYAVKALRLHDLRANLASMGGAFNNEALEAEFKALEAWEASLFARPERGEQLLIEAIASVFGALAPHQDMTTLEVYQALQKPAAGHPVGRLYMLSAIGDENGRLNELGRILAKLSRDRLLPTTRNVGGAQAAAYRLRREGDPSGMTGMIHDRLPGRPSAAEARATAAEPRQATPLPASGPEAPPDTTRKPGAPAKLAGKHKR